ncbi:glycosyl transferase [Bacteroidia bacterium]|nr:glycosyl transferase [Bacteroidia bacterium]
MKISIITACYNAASTIRTTIESVWAQTYSDIEYLIIDGNSTDNTLKIIKEYQSNQKNHRLEIISEKDAGMYDALNKGIRMASGEIIGILHSDDFYNHPDCLERVAETFQNPAVDSCFADIRFVNPENIEKTVRYYSSANFNPGKFRFGFMPAHPTFFVRKSYFDQTGYYKTDYRIAADFELLMRFLYRNRLSYRYIPLDMIKMRTGGKSTNSWKSNFILNREIVRACRENGVYTNLLILSLKYFIKIFEFIKTKN